MRSAGATPTRNNMDLLPIHRAVSISSWSECPHLKRIAAEVPGLAFRSLRDKSEAEAMSRISYLSWKADGIEWLVSPEDMAFGLGSLDDGRIGTEVVFAEMNGTPIGYSQVGWDPTNAAEAYYVHSVHILPEWRVKGLREAMFMSNEDRVRAIHRLHGSTSGRGVQLWAIDSADEWKGLVESADYRPTWHLLEMVHTDLGSVGDPPVPAGLDFSPVRAEEYRKVWSLCRDCFSGEVWSPPDKWGDDMFREWVGSETFTPSLWKVARSGNEVVGLVENSISEEECRVLGRKVAHANRVCVRDDWRRKGVATYLLTSSLKHLRDNGVEEVTLDTEVENVSMAMRVYASVGFVVRRNFTFYRKPL